MATLGTTELVAVRNALERAGSPNYTKAQINAAAQAVETFLTSNAAAVSSAIDAASTPFTFTNAQKKLIVAYVLDAKFVRDR